MTSNSTLTAEWFWRDDVQFASKPWRAIQKHNGRILQGRNFKRESDARMCAENWASDAKRTGRLS